MNVDRRSCTQGVRSHAVFAPITERLPIVKGRLDQNASTATSYAWLVWQKDQAQSVWQTKLIPPCRKQLEREGDYLPPAEPQSLSLQEGEGFSDTAQAAQLSLF
jgi:hypothetical protein